MLLPLLLLFSLLGSEGALVPDLVGDAGSCASSWNPNWKADMLKISHENYFHFLT